MKKKKQDWRNKPRKPAKQKKSKAIGGRCTQAEYEIISRKAWTQNIPLAEFVRLSCLAKALEK